LKVQTQSHFHRALDSSVETMSNEFEKITFRISSTTALDKGNECFIRVDLSLSTFGVKT
jgi:hypothetical protein